MAVYKASTQRSAATNVTPATATATATHNAAAQRNLSFTVSSARAVRIYYVHTDQIDTPRQITAASNNAVMWRWDNQDAFGDNTPIEKPSGSGQAFKYHLRFAGQIYDPETDTSYNYFRDYDANLGRYAQSDPIGLEGGINTYAYVGGNPLQYSDPTGKCPWCFAAVVGGIVGGGFNLIGQLNGNDPINLNSVIIATLAGATGGATGTFIGSLSKSLGGALVMNAVAGSTINMVSGIADDKVNCRAWEQNVGKNWLVGAAFGGAGGAVSRSISNYSRSAQSWINLQGRSRTRLQAKLGGQQLRGLAMQPVPLLVAQIHS